MVTTRDTTFNLEGALSSMGLPVNGVTVRLFDYWNIQGVLSKHFICEVVTKDRGNFKFNVRKGIYSLEILPSDNTRFARQSVETIHVTGDKSLSIGIKPGAIFSGQACSHEGDPLSHAELLLFAIEPHVLKTRVLLDDNGEFNITLPAGKYYLALRHLESDRHGTSIPFVCPIFEVVEFSRDFQHKIKLPTLHRFDGRVHDKNGNPLQGVKARIIALGRVENIFAQDVPLEVDATTNGEGYFSCYLQKGEYNVRLLPARESAFAEQSFGPFAVATNMLEEFALDKGHTLKGKVTHNGNAFKNAIINIIGSEISSSKETNDEGCFEFCVPQADYELTVITPPDSLGTSPELGLAPAVRSVSLLSSTELTVELEEGVLVTGIVQDAKGKPCPGVQLSLFSTNNGGFDAKANKQPLWVGITGDDGSYEFRLMPERYWLVLNNQASTGHLVDVSGTEQNNDFKINDVCLVQIEVISDLDEAIANVQVSARPYEPALSAKMADAIESSIPLFTNNNGQCVLALPSGIYSIYLQPPEHSSFKSRTLRQLSVGADMHKKVKLEPKNH